MRNRVAEGLELLVRGRQLTRAPLHTRLQLRRLRTQLGLLGLQGCLLLLSLSYVASGRVDQIVVCTGPVVPKQPSVRPVATAVAVLE